MFARERVERVVRAHGCVEVLQTEYVSCGRLTLCVCGLEDQEVFVLCLGISLIGYTACTLHIRVPMTVVDFVSFIFTNVMPVEATYRMDHACVVIILSVPLNGDLDADMMYITCRSRAHSAGSANPHVFFRGTDTFLMFKDVFFCMNWTGCVSDRLENIDFRHPLSDQVTSNMSI